MSTKELLKLRFLEHEVKTLRSLLIGIASQDPEGNYNPKFVTELLAASDEKPTASFADKSSFLAELGQL